MQETYQDLEGYSSSIGKAIVQAYANMKIVPAPMYNLDADIKYFTPSIGDIRVGYECEFGGAMGATGQLWKSFVVDTSNIKAVIRDIALIRVPYLTKEQIEAEGWESYLNGYKKGSMYCLPHVLRTDSNTIHNITFHTIEPSVHIYFFGQCKDINTFRYICKLLSI
jgi:hypothetical protein